MTRRILSDAVEGRWARAVGEVLLIVVGILAALAIDAGIERRAERQTAAHYLGLLDRDLGQAIAQLEELRLFSEDQFAVGLRSQAALAGGVPPSARDSLASDFTLLSARRTLRIPRAAYTDLVATGNLSVIDNPTVRDDVVRFFGEVERTELIHDRNNTWAVDRRYQDALFGTGLVVPRVYQTPVTAMSTALDRVAEAGAPVAGSDRLWRLPGDHTDVETLRAALALRVIVASVAMENATRLAEQAAVLRRGIRAERRRLGGAASPADIPDSAEASDPS